jgi:hypothetical protein
MTGINADGFKKPPKNGRKLNRSYCNEVCHNYKANKPQCNKGADPYTTHAYCKKCDGVWMKRESCVTSKTGQLRCPCCNIQVRTTAKRKQARATRTYPE